MPLHWLYCLILATPAIAHDIPNARVDRSIQATIEPERLLVDYQVGISELTLTQDLRQIIGELPGADRRGWFEEYGRVSGPLNAKGVLVTVNGEEVELRAVGFDLSIEGHPLFTFHFEATIAPRGRLTLNDTNYLASEGTSRLALRPGIGVRVDGDGLPTDVTLIPIRPVWQLDKNEERRTRRLTVDYALGANPQPIPPSVSTTSTSAPKPDDALSRLLDRDAGQTWPILSLVAFLLGAAHALQPGHGKTLVLASSLGPDSSPSKGALLGLATASVHLASVALIAGILWTTRAIRPEQVHLVLAHATGFLIAAIGSWKLGRHLAGYGEHVEESARGLTHLRGILPIALVGGAVPCWEAVTLILVAEAIDRLRLGLTLLVAFSLGMAVVLVAVGAMSSRFRRLFERFDSRGVWERRFGIFGALILLGIGLMLLGVG
jgi:ABC-type nickel/cobalt efflux system permease component RcnA